jgi:uncharacterized membrane protein
MKFVEKYENYLDDGIIIIQLIAYTISFLLISISIIRSIIRYVVEYVDPNIDPLTVFEHTRFDLAESSVLSLSFILGVEILKLFHIKTYKQLTIVLCLVGIKLLITYFLTKEIQRSSKKIIKY